MAKRTPSKQQLPRRHFLLEQMIPMQPYLVRLMKDLRGVVIRRRHLRRWLELADNGPQRDYAHRRQRHEATAELRQLAQQRQQLLHELAQVEVSVGNVLRGEMFFRCLIDHREAFFVWYDDQPLPSHWRFARGTDLHPIPSRWFVASEPDSSCGTTADRL